MGPALTKEPEHKNPIALPDKTIPELNVSENLKLKFEYKNQIAPGSTEHELNVKEHVNLDHMKHTNIGLVWMEVVAELSEITHLRRRSSFTRH